MSELLTSPKLWALLCIGVLVLGPLMTLYGLWRKDKIVMEEAAKWGQALSGPRTAQAAQKAQVDELHRLVAQLSAKPGAAEADEPK